jgi:hypothetical protein
VDRGRGDGSGTAKRRPPPAWGTAGERSDGGERLEAVVGTRAEALAELEAALLAEETCNDVTRRVIEHAIDLKHWQNLPSKPARSSPPTV